MMINLITCTLKILTNLCFIKQKLKIKDFNMFLKDFNMYIKDFKKFMFHKTKTKNKKWFKQLPVPFKIYADFECNLKNVVCYEGTYTKKYHEHVPCSYAYKVVCIDDK